MFRNPIDAYLYLIECNIVIYYDVKNYIKTVEKNLCSAYLKTNLPKTGYFKENVEMHFFFEQG